MHVTASWRQRWTFASTLFGVLAIMSITAEAQDRRLVDAVKHHDSAVIGALLAEHVDVNIPEVDGTTALHWAVHHDDAQLVGDLLRAGATVEAENRYGIKPLSIACTNGSAVVVDALLKAGADPNTFQPEGETALLTAARSGSVDVVKLLIARGADVNAKETWRSQTAVMWAAAEGHVEVVRLLVSHGADIEARSTLPVTAAAAVRRPAGGHRPGGLTALQFAVRGGHIDTVVALLDAGGNANEIAPSGYSLLHLAIMNAHFELAAALLEKGADPNAVGPLPSGLTPLHHLVQVRRPLWSTRPSPVPTGNLDSLQLVQALLEHGAHVDAPLPKPPERGRAAVDDERVPDPGEGATPLWLAARGPDPEVMRALLAAGADPLVKTDDEVTVLMTAAGIGYRQGPREKLEADVLEAVQIALQHGGDVHATDVDGNTALHGAARRGVNSTVLLLLEHGAEIDAKNALGQTPLDIAEDTRLDGRVQPQTAALLRKLMNERAGAQ